MMQSHTTAIVYAIDATTFAVMGAPSCVPYIFAGLSMIQVFFIGLHEQRARQRLEVDRVGRIAAAIRLSGGKR